MLIHGVGINDREFKSSIKGKVVNSYRLWNDMIRRCYSEKSLNRDTSYKNCKVSEYFLNYSNFHKWCLEQKYYNFEGYQLDKDILSGEIYSPDTCEFIPKKVNSILVNKKASRGEYPIGVHYRKDNSKFSSNIGFYNGGKHKVIHLGYFETPEEAFYAYKHEKEKYIKSIAVEYKDRITERAFNGLMNYEINIDD